MAEKVKEFKGDLEAEDVDQSQRLIIRELL